MDNVAITPVILCGGAGTRLWPLSRADRPKQLLSLLGQKSLLANTLARFTSASGDAFAPPIIVTGASMEAAVRAECRNEKEARFVIEPAPRNTAPAIAAATCLVSEHDPEALIVAAPADHHISNPEAFNAAILDAAPAAKDGALVTFGISPDRAETGFGYIRAISGSASVRRVEAFIEKPAPAKAEEFIASGEYLWNAGVFLFRARDMLHALETLAPNVLAAASEAIEGARRRRDTVYLASDAFARAPSISIDRAVMEQADNVMVAPVNVGWSDIGSWEALWRAGAPDDAGMVQSGDVVSVNADNCFARSEGPLLALAGVSDIAVIAAPDAVLVTPLANSKNVEGVVEALKAAHRSHTTLSPSGAGLLHDRVHRLRTWLMDSALPLWAEHGVDEAGAFYEGLTLDGAPARDAVRRFRVQARQIYCFSQAAALGWEGPAEEIVLRGLSHWERWRGPEGGWPHLIAPNLDVHDATMDTYDQAFAILAFAWANQLTGDRRWITEADALLAILDSKLLDHTTGGYWDTTARTLPRRQNPHMHLLEACLALHQATGESRYIARARQIVELFHARFVDRRIGALLEFFDANWSPAAGEPGLIVEPGHQLEWAFLLSCYEKVSGENCGDAITQLVAHAWAFGSNPHTNLIIDEGTRDGLPRRSSARCWVQTEALRAALVMRERGHPDAENRAVAIIDALLTRYLSVTPTGAWIDQFDEVGEPIYAPVPVPASTLYHLMGAIVMCIEAVEEARE